MTFWLFLWMNQRLDYQLILVRSYQLFSVFLTRFVVLTFISRSQFVQRQSYTGQNLMNLFFYLSKGVLFKLSNLKRYFRVKPIFQQNSCYIFLINSNQGTRLTLEPFIITPLYSIYEQTPHFNHLHNDSIFNNRIPLLTSVTEPVIQTFSLLILKIQKYLLIKGHSLKNAHKYDVLATGMESPIMLPLNLLQNAFYAMSARENIDIKIHQEDHLVKRKIQGRGIEIYPTLIHHQNFFPNERGNNGQKKAIKWIGLDLSFCKNIVKPYIKLIKINNGCQKSCLLTATLPETQYAETAYSP